jgi:L-amino acid N-acyltransferase YncA
LCGGDRYLQPHIDHSFAACPEQPVSYDFFNWFLEDARGYPAVIAQAEKEASLGFGLLRPYHPSPTFAKTAEITYYIIIRR